MKIWNIDILDRTFCHAVIRLELWSAPLNAQIQQSRLQWEQINFHSNEISDNFSL